MYQVGTFQPPSVYAGRRVTFDAEVFTIEGVGPVDVRTLPGYAASREFGYANEAARAWTEERVRAAGAVDAPAAGASRKAPTAAWLAVGAVVLVVAGATIAMAVSRPTPAPLPAPPINTQVDHTQDSNLPTVPPEIADDTSDTPPPVVVPNTPTVVIPPNDGPSPHARTLPGTWRVKSGANKGNTYTLNKDGRAWWKTSSSNWELEWWTSGNTLTLRRETVYFEYTYKISTDGWTMDWADQRDGGKSVLTRQ